jgi:hypothetical protein
LRTSFKRVSFVEQHEHDFDCPGISARQQAVIRQRLTASRLNERDAGSGYSCPENDL